MIEERDANPTADTPGRFRGRRAPTALTAGGTESSEVVARLSGTESSNPLPSSGESAANLTMSSQHEVMSDAIDLPALGVVISSLCELVHVRAGGGRGKAGT
jgi:hypothetical protein